MAEIVRSLQLNNNITLALNRCSTPLLIFLTCPLHRSIYWLVSWFATEKAGSPIASGWSAAPVPRFNRVIRDIQRRALDDCKEGEKNATGGLKKYQGKQ